MNKLILIFLLTIKMPALANSFPVDSIGIKTIKDKKFLLHKVSAHEGWFAIARKYNISYADVRLANKKHGDDLKIDEVVLVPLFKYDVSSYANKTTTEKTSPEIKKTGREATEHGLAAWIHDEDGNPKQYYALHRTAALGTIIKVTNKMNSQYVYVKVIGALPDTGDNNDLIIKISKASAEKLGVRDRKFQCELTYTVYEVTQPQTKAEQ
jgi:peptidoglycan endopeptidase LytF